jgi:cytochrome c biogenesis protein CcdA
MYPHWARLEESSSILPVSFYHITYGHRTASAFQAYQVYETPTFIVFVKGKPVARYVGAFEGENITRAMLSWALSAAGFSLAPTPHELAREGMEVFNSKCASCHLEVTSLDREAIRRWISEGIRLNDKLAYSFMTALNKNMTIEDYYGGYGALESAVASMRKYIDLSSYELDRVTYLLSYLSRALLGLEPPDLSLANASAYSQAKASSRGSESTPLGGSSLAGIVTGVSALAAFVAGLVAAFSPCVLPLLVAQAATVSVSGKRLSLASCGMCSVSSFVGVLAVALLFVVASTAIVHIQQVLLPVIAAAIIAAGISSLVGAPIELEGLFRVRRGGIVGFCAAYGLLAVQCSLPLVAGSLLLVAGAGAVTSSIIVAVSFALGISVPLAAALYAASRAGSSLLERVMEKNRLLNIVGGLVLSSSGVFLLAYSLGLI